jgi:Holliday junction DNA helicase RuvA
LIARLRGTVIERDGTRGIVDVGGVGYEVFAPNRSWDGWATGETVTVHIHTQVREDAITLYGFSSDIDKRSFETLIGVSGFGPKVALSALDALGADELYRAVEGDDVVTLGRIPGVGAKKAQRLALELKGKLPVSFVVPVRQVRASPSDPLPLALAQLEYGKTEIDRALAALDKQGIGADAPLQERIKAALKALAGGAA